MSILTAKQESFCQFVLSEANASDAYRKAYGAENMAPPTVNRRAKELMDNGKIKARIAELRAPVVESLQITLADHLNDLKILRDAAKDKEQYSAAISAEVSRGKACGFYDPKGQKDDGGKSDLAETLNKLIDKLPS